MDRKGEGRVVLSEKGVCIGGRGLWREKWGVLGQVLPSLWPQPPLSCWKPPIYPLPLTLVISPTYSHTAPPPFPLSPPAPQTILFVQGFKKPGPLNHYLPTIAIPPSPPILLDLQDCIPSTSRLVLNSSSHYYLNWITFSFKNIKHMSLLRLT